MAELRASIRLCVVLAVVAFALAGGASTAQACDASNQHEFGISPGCFDVRFAAAPTAGNPAPDFDRAGGHPYDMSTLIRLNAPEEFHPVHLRYWPPEALRDISIGFPPGIAANPNAVASCSFEELAGAVKYPECPADSQLGEVTNYTAFFFSIEVYTLPLYRMEPPPGVAARFGFNVTGAPIVFDATLDSETGGLSIDFTKLSQALPFTGFGVSIWGVPADPSHTPRRACPGQTPPGGGFFEGAPPANPSTCPSSLPPRAFLRLPTSCTGPAAMTARYASWEHPENVKFVSAPTHAAPGLLGDPTAGGGYPAPYPGLAKASWGAPKGFSGCAQLPFSPSLEVRTTSQAASSPTGLDVEVEFPQDGADDPGQTSEADLKGMVTKFPAGLSLNPSVASGLTACTAAEVDLDSNSPATCPNASKLGTVEMETPFFSTPMAGSIFVAKDGVDGSEAALPAYLVAESNGTAIKMLVEVDIDDDNRLGASFEDAPQIPLERLRIHFFGGERAPFVTPASCGPLTATGRFTPWSGTPTVALSDTSAITTGPGGGPCPQGRPFAPGFRAGVTSPLAGGDSGTLKVNLTRDDDEQEPVSLRMSMPPGLSASLDDVETCSKAALAAAEERDGAKELEAPSCPASSRLGSAQAIVGAGAEPFQMKGGRVYLAGPFKGAAFSFAVVLPAVAGPLDLGTLTLRMPLRVSPRDGRLTLEGELPSSQEGVKLNLRRLTLNVDRPNFITNPTNCRRTSVDGRFEGDAGAVAKVSAPFRMVDCALLGFDPGLRVKVLGGRSAANHAAHPSLRTTLTARRGDANLERAAFVFPDSALLDPTHIRGVCRRAEFAREKCPKDSVYGYARVISPLLKKPMRGPVYLRTSDNKLPDLVASVRGKFDLDLAARLGFSDGRMHMVMDSLPDVPVSKLAITTFGGRRGLFVNNRNICAKPSAMTAELAAQNGKRVDRTARLEAPC